jgi:hypothetical protein
MKFRPEYVRQGYAMARCGLSEVQLADLFDVSVPTLAAWKRSEPEFHAAVAAGKAEADARFALGNAGLTVGAYLDDATLAFMGIVPAAVSPSIN